MGVGWLEMCSKASWRSPSPGMRGVRGALQLGSTPPKLQLGTTPPCGPDAPPSRPRLDINKDGTVDYTEWTQTIALKVLPGPGRMHLRGLVACNPSPRACGNAGCILSVLSLFLSLSLSRRPRHSCSLIASSWCSKPHAACPVRNRCPPCAVLHAAVSSSSRALVLDTCFSQHASWHKFSPSPLPG